MGVYIQNMEKPKGCANCPCADDENRFCLAAMQYIPMFGKPNFCPLIEIDRPHGRLIDGDLVADMLDSMMAHGTLNRAYDEVTDVPTILESEE